MSAETQPRTLKDVPVQEMPVHVRKQAALDLLQQARGAGQPEPTAPVLVTQTGLSTSQAYDIKRKFRGKPVVTHRKGFRRTPKSESWALIQDFLDAHPGENYSRAELSRATGVPPDTISLLWQQKLGVTFSKWREQGESWHERPSARADVAVQAGSLPDRLSGEYADGTTFTVCGRIGTEILAEQGGEIVRLTVRPLTGGA